MCPDSAGQRTLLFSGLIHQTTNWIKFFPYFSQITGFDISCKLSPLETICIKYQNLFSGKNKKKKKYFNVLSAENFT